MIANWRVADFPFVFRRVEGTDTLENFNTTDTLENFNTSVSELVSGYVDVWLSSLDTRVEGVKRLFDNAMKKLKKAGQTVQHQKRRSKETELPTIDDIYKRLIATCDEIAQVPADFFHANVNSGPHVVLKDHLPDDPAENLKTLDRVLCTQEYVQRFQLESRDCLKIFMDRTSEDEPSFAYQYRMFIAQCYTQTMGRVARTYGHVYFSYYLNSPNANADQIGKELADKIHTLASRICHTPIEGFDSPVSKQKIYIESINKCLPNIALDEKLNNHFLYHIHSFAGENAPFLDSVLIKRPVSPEHVLLGEIH